MNAKLCATVTGATRTLRDFFALADDDRAAHRVAALGANPTLSTLAEQVSATAGSAGWQHALMDIAGAIPDLLEVDLASVLSGAWKTDAELGRFADTQRYPPEETVIVELTTHVVTSRHRPHLEVLLDDEPCGRLDFEVEVAVRVDGAVLTIRDGNILKATTDACAASGRITCEGQTLAERESVPLQLPGAFVFDQPIRIVPPPTGWEHTPLS